MKKFLSLLTILSVLFAFTALMPDAQAAVDKKINANVKVKRVPVGTIITLKFLDSVSSAANELGDGFDMMIVDNVKVDNEIVIPKGSVVRGSLEELQKGKRLYKGGMIRIYFDHVVSATGKQVRFHAGICNNPNITYDGALSSNTNYGTAIKKTAQKSKNIVTTPTSRAWEKGENIAGGKAKYVFAPLTALVTAPVAGIYFVGDSVADLFKKGEDMTVNQGDIIKVQLLKPIDMPVY